MPLGGNRFSDERWRRLAAVVYARPMANVAGAPFDRNKMAAVFYALTLVGAFVWTWFAGRPWWRMFWDPERATPGLVALGILVGGAAGLVVVALSRLSVRRFRWGRELYRWFAALLGPVSWRDALLLAALSSVGEETFFRGAMQPSVGLWWASLAFGLLHVPPRCRLVGWTAFAAALGLCFGVLTNWTGNLAGAVVSHFVINLFNLRQLSAFVGDGGAPDRDRPDAIDSPPHG